MKPNIPKAGEMSRDVTPFVGVWIETDKQQDGKGSKMVTPFVGVWIETILHVCI